jgi:hypothetical protein
MEFRHCLTCVFLVECNLSRVAVCIRVITLRLLHTYRLVCLFGRAFLSLSLGAGRTVNALVRTVRAQAVPLPMPGTPVRCFGPHWDLSLTRCAPWPDLDDGGSIRQCNTPNVGVNLYL